MIAQADALVEALRIFATGENDDPCDEAVNTLERLKGQALERYGDRPALVAVCQAPRRNGSSRSLLVQAMQLAASVKAIVAAMNEKYDVGD